MQKVNILGAQIDNLTTVEFLNTLEKWINSNSLKKTVITANVDHLMKIQKDDEFKRVYEESDLITADGVPLIWASKYLGTPLKEKISGSDLLPLIFQKAVENKWRLFFLGGRPGAADLALKNLSQKFGNLEVYTHCPPFGFEKNKNLLDEIEQMVNTFQPHLLLVGLGAPKQEKWIHKNKAKLHFNIAIGIGVSFEFEAGLVKRAPKFLQKIGFEWLWRIIQEPKRLWKRYIIDDMPFFLKIYQQKKTKHG